MINIKALIIILLLPTLAQAQVSIVNALPEIDADNGWSGKLSLSGSWEDNNNSDNELLLSGAGVVGYRESLWLFHFVAKGVYEEESGNGVEGSTMEHLRARLNLGEMIFPIATLMALSKGNRAGRNDWVNRIGFEIFAQHEHDKYRAINTRALFGLGPTHTVIQNDKINIMVGSAYMVETLDFIRDISSELNHRWSSYLQLNINPNNIFSIDGVTFLQFKIDDFSDYLYMGNIALKVMATKHFGLKLNFGANFDNNPPPSIKKFGGSIGSEIFVEF
jgi:hypothetical protein